MSDNYFVRAVGTQKTGDSKLMKHEEAMRVLYDEYATILKDLGGEDSIDCAYLDAEKETFEVEDSSGEKYQTMYLLPENKKSGLAYYLEEIRREVSRVDDFAKLYQYEFQDMGVYDCTWNIRMLLDKLDKDKDASRRDDAIALFVHNGVIEGGFTTDSGIKVTVCDFDSDMDDEAAENAYWDECRKCGMKQFAPNIYHPKMQEK